MVTRATLRARPYKNIPAGTIRDGKAGVFPGSPPLDENQGLNRLLREEGAEAMGTASPALGPSNRGSRPRHRTCQRQQQPNRRGSALTPADLCRAQDRQQEGKNYARGGAPKDL